MEQLKQANIWELLSKNCSVSEIFTYKEIGNSLHLLVITWITKEFPTRPTSMMKPKKVGTSQALTSTGGLSELQTCCIQTNTLDRDQSLIPPSSSRIKANDISAININISVYNSQYKSRVQETQKNKDNRDFKSNNQDVNENYQLQFRWFNKSIRWHVLTFEILLYICIYF